MEDTENKCPDCEGTGVKVEMMPVQVCCGRPTENGSCCGYAEIGYEPEQVQCEKCRATGIIQT